MPTDLHCRNATPVDDADALLSLSWEQLRADLLAAQAGTQSHAVPDGHLRWGTPPPRDLPGRNGSAMPSPPTHLESELQKVAFDTRLEASPGTEASTTPQTYTQPAVLPAAGRLTVTHVRSRDLGLVAADGVLGKATWETLCQALREAVEESGPDSQVAVDLRRAEFLDDSAYGALVSAHLRLSGLGRRLFVVLGPGGAGAAWIVNMGLDTLLTRVDTPDCLTKLRLPRRDTGKRS
jgi:anti-anti-sigma regulatory factor